MIFYDLIVNQIYSDQWHLVVAAKYLTADLSPLISIESTLSLSYSIFRTEKMNFEVSFCVIFGGGEEIVCVLFSRRNLCIFI